ncbi:hypothetical protein BH10PAT1_BH10PAT1_5310 [soil metagenome]
MIKTDLLNLIDKSSSPVSVPEILQKISANKTTIYREIEKFVSEGVIDEIDLGDGKKRYESIKLGHHHHLVCIKCKSITEFNLDDDFSTEEKKIKKTKKFTVLKHNLEFFGLCHNCI